MRAGPSDKDVSNENSAEKLVGIEDFLAQKAAREQEQSLFGGGMFPSDFATAAASNEITVQAATLKVGHSQALVGFWKVGVPSVAVFDAHHWWGNITALANYL